MYFCTPQTYIATLIKYAHFAVYTVLSTGMSGMHVQLYLIF